MNEALVDAIRRKRAILFVGSGVSASCGLPSWGKLIEKIGAKLGYDPRVFELLGSYPQLAGFYKREKGSLGQLRSELDVEWHQNLDISKSPIHRLIVQLQFPVIYTTNYDRYLEKAFEHYKIPYTRIVSINDFVDASGTQIVKFHGDFSDDNSLVLTENDYFERMNFETPLDIRLRADLMGRTVLFLGYSLSDINVRYMLFRLQKLWRASATKEAPESFIFLTKPNAVQEALLRDRGVIPLTSEQDNPTDATISFLQDIQLATGMPQRPSPQ